MTSTKERHDLEVVARFVEREVVTLRHQQTMFGDLRNLLVNPQAGTLRFGHFFFSTIGSWYSTAMLIALRALTETSSRGKNALSLTGLLHRIASFTPAEFTVPEINVAKADLKLLELEASKLYSFTSQIVAHRDAAPKALPVDEFEIHRVLDLVEEILARHLNMVFGSSYRPLVMEADPFWTDLLFSFPWNSPPDFLERLALGRDTRITLKGNERDFTRSAVYGQRPTDEDLASYSLTREDLDRVRAESLLAGDDDPSPG